MHASSRTLAKTCFLAKLAFSIIDRRRDLVRVLPSSLPIVSARIYDRSAHELVRCHYHRLFAVAQFCYLYEGFRGSSQGQAELFTLV